MAKASPSFVNMVRPGAQSASGRITLALVLALTAVPSHARDPLAPLAPPIVDEAGTIDDFYAAHPGQPLWLTEDGRAAQAILGLLSSAALDGLDPQQFDTPDLRMMLSKAGFGSAKARMRGDRALSQALVDYATALRTGADSGTGWEVADPRVAPRAPGARTLLEAAQASTDRAAFVEGMPWMHPSYADLRRALIAEADPGRAETLRLNLSRVRLLPASTTGRYVLVNAAAQRLYMIEDGRVVDTMKVVVGKTEQPTPMLASVIDHADLNPYWNLPIDLVAERVAPHVLKQGLGYLKAQGYEVLSGFDADATPIDPSTIDWKAAADNKLQLRMRQQPGPANAMGVMKFMFPNRHGVYLHDTPNKELMVNDARLASAGCVRLEDAPRLGAWMFGNPIKADGAAPEQRANLPAPVPVFLAYLTAFPGDDGQVVFYSDIYSRDRARLASR